MEKHQLSSYVRGQFQEISKKLESACEIGLKSPEEGYALFEKQLRALEPEDVPDVLYAFLREKLSDTSNALTAKAPEEMRDKHASFIRYLNRSYPNLQPLFRRGIDSTQRIISPKGMEALVAVMREEKKLPFDVLVCGNLGKLTSLLEDIRGDIENFEEGKRFGAIVRSSSTFHLTPILIEKREGRLHVFISDSLGDRSFGKDAYYNRILDCVSATLPDALVFVSNVQRQVDSSNCPVFSMRDLIQLAEMPDIFTKLTDEGQLEADETKSGFPYSKVNVLPAKMMKMAQSSSKLDTYMREHPLKRTASLQKAREGIVKVEGKNLSQFVVRKYLKYENEIIRRVLIDN
jgi:hypothetical protein